MDNHYISYLYTKSLGYQASQSYKYDSVQKYIELQTQKPNYKYHWTNQYPDILYCILYIYAVINKIYLICDDDKRRIKEEFESDHCDWLFKSYFQCHDFSTPFLDKEYALTNNIIADIYKEIQRRSFSIKTSFDFYQDLCSLEHELVNSPEESLSLLFPFLLSIYNKDNDAYYSDNEQEELIHSIINHRNIRYIYRIDYSYHYYIDKRGHHYLINLKDEVAESIISKLLLTTDNYSLSSSYDNSPYFIFNGNNAYCIEESLNKLASKIEGGKNKGIIVIPTDFTFQPEMKRLLKYWAHLRKISHIITLNYSDNDHNCKANELKNTHHLQTLILINYDYYSTNDITIAFTNASSNVDSLSEYIIQKFLNSGRCERIEQDEAIISIPSDFISKYDGSIDPFFYHLQKKLFEEKADNIAQFEELFSFVDIKKSNNEIYQTNQMISREIIKFGYDSLNYDLTRNVFVTGPAILENNGTEFLCLKENKQYEIMVSSDNPLFAGLYFRNDLYLPEYAALLLMREELKYIWDIVNGKTVLCKNNILQYLTFNIPSIEHQWRVISSYDNKGNILQKKESDRVGISIISRKALSKYEKLTNIGNANKYYQLIATLAEISIIKEKYKIDSSIIQSVRNQDRINLYTILNDSEIQALTEDFPFIVDYCCNAYKMDISYSNLLEHTQPVELTRFCISLLSPESGSKIYNPFAGFGSYFAFISNCECIGEEISPEAAFIANIRLTLSGKQSRVTCGNSLDTINDNTHQYDYIITTPPLFKTEIKNNNYLDIGHLNRVLKDLYNNKLSENGRMVLIVPLAFSYDSNYGKIRKQLLKEGTVEYFISLPKVFTPLSSESYSVIVINKARRRKDVLVSTSNTLLVDGTSFYQESASISTPGKFLFEKLQSAIVNNDDKYCLRRNLNDYKANFCPSRFFNEKPEVPEGKVLIQFKELINKGNKKKVMATSTSLCVRGKDLYDHYCSFEVNPSGQCRVGKRYFVIEKPSILIKIENDSIKVGYLKNTPALVDRNIYPLSINEIVKPEYLLKELLSDYVKKQMKASLVFEKRSGHNRLQDMMEIEISIPSIHEQDIELKNDALSELEKANLKIKKQFDLYVEDTHMKKHAIGQNILNLSSYWQSLLLARDLNNGSLPDDYVLGKKHPLIVKDIINKISMYLAEVSRGIENFTYAEDPRFAEKTDIIVDSFLREYIESHSNPEYEILYQPNIDITSLGIIHFSKEALKIILQNIISNAWRHGFKNRKEGNYIKIDWYETEEEVHINISNNGMPIDESMEKDRLFEFGTSTQRGISDMEGHTHSGLGCYQIKALMNIDNQGDVSVISNPGSEFAVTFNLKFFK